MNLKETIPSTDTDGSEQLENVEYLNYLGRMRTNNEGYTSETKSKIGNAKTNNQQEKAFSVAHWTCI